ncbi:hypothetical protein LXL04_023256 [Taraxacum kok-saghyz]
MLSITILYNLWKTFMKSTLTNHLVQFVENIHEVNSYSWGAAFLASLYVGIEKFKSTKTPKKRVDGNCWPLLVFFCLRILQLCTNLGINIPLENQRAPLLDYCMGPMKQMAKYSTEH